MGAAWSDAKGRAAWMGSLVGGPVSRQANEIRGVGATDELRLERNLGREGLSVEVQFDLARSKPILLWRIALVNRGRSAVRLDRFDLLRVGPRARSSPSRSWLVDLVRGPQPAASPGALRLSESPGPMSCFVNGWQGWSFAGSLREHQRQPRFKLGPLQSPMHDNGGTRIPNQPGHFISEMFTCLNDLDSGACLIAGFLSQKQAFGSAEVWLDRFAPSLWLRESGDGVRLEPGRSFVTDWACLLLAMRGEDFLGEYLSCAGEANGARHPQTEPVGWCSWYQFFAKVSETDLLGNLESARQKRARLPIDVIQLDDGYEVEVGDWTRRNPRFATGFRELASRIRDAGFTPGLWLAPFLAKGSSQLAHEHPNWMLRGRFLGRASAGYALDSFSGALDVTRPEVLTCIRSLIRTAASDWGFGYLKLDFLYAAALRGRRADPTCTRAQALRRALEAIREAAGEKTFLLGCGCPLGPGIGIFDAMRIGEDVDRNWFPTYSLLTHYLRDDPEFPAARNAIRNTLTRSALSRRWWLNDPDCLIVRDMDSHLTRPERESLVTALAVSGGMIVFSDDLRSLSESSLQMAQVLLPCHGAAGAVLDWAERDFPSLVLATHQGALGRWTTLAVFNWGDREADVEVPRERVGWAEGMIVHSFWDDGFHELRGERLTLKGIEPHGCRLLAAFPRKETASWVGSTLHVSQGREVEGWTVGRDTASWRVRLGRMAEGKVFLALPGRLTKAELDGRPFSGNERGRGIWEFNLSIEESAELRVWYE
jgi:alpha-galactosidase